jgi:hypothetical protein
MLVLSTLQLFSALTHRKTGLGYYHFSWTLQYLQGHFFKNNRRKKTTANPLLYIYFKDSKLQYNLTTELYRKERANFIW